VLSPQYPARLLAALLTSKVQLRGAEWLPTCPEIVLAAKSRP
jgi:hypothetical protein